MISTVLSIFLGHQKKTLSRRELRARVPISPPDILYRSRPSVGGPSVARPFLRTQRRVSRESTPWCSALMPASEGNPSALIFVRRSVFMAARRLIGRLFRDGFRTPSTSAECCFPAAEFELQIAPLASQQAYLITRLRPQCAGRNQSVGIMGGLPSASAASASVRQSRLLSTFERGTATTVRLQDLRRLDR
jgi:hypothetical protein